MQRPSQLSETPSTYVRVFKKLFITQGALANSKEFKPIAKNILDSRFTRQWWSVNKEAISRHFTILDAKQK